MELEIWIVVVNKYGLTEGVTMFMSKNQAVLEANAIMSEHYSEKADTLHDEGYLKPLWTGIEEVECPVCDEYIITIHSDTIELIDDRIG